MPNSSVDTIRDQDPLTALATLADARRSLEAETELQVRRARNQGLSWELIAAALGVSRQAVHKKYAVRGGLLGRKS